MCRATKHEPAIRHVVITSSFAAINDVKGAPNVGTRFDSDTWNPATYEEALGAKDAPPFVYAASKKFAEKAFWDFVEKEKPSWSGTAINPRASSALPARCLVDSSTQP